ncbi:hypothetical protein JCM11491_000743 [Sporobolomyces phaffii]
MTEVAGSSTLSPPPPAVADIDPAPVQEMALTGDTELPAAGVDANKEDPTTANQASVEPPAAPEPEQDPTEKKRVQDQLRQESRKRGNRMFGMMLGTLKRAKQQVDTSVESDSMKKRIELEKKLKDKLDGERKVMHLRTEREKEVRDLKASVSKKEEEISSADAIYRVRHDAKYNLAGFLCTSFPLPTPASTTDSVSVPFNPRLPHSMHLTTPPTSSANRPIYYLPYRLLPSQEDRIEDQIDIVKKATKRDQDEWRDLKAGKQKELRKLRDELEAKVEEVGRLEREDRQRKRRDAEEREEHERRERDKRRRVGREDERDDPAKVERMEDVVENGSTRSGSPPVAPVAAAAKESEVESKEAPAAARDRDDSEQHEDGKENDKMDLAGDDDLEY